MHSTSCEMPGWMNHKPESRLPGEIPKTSDMQMIPGGGHSNPLQHSCLENPINRGAWGGGCPLGCKESETIEVTEHIHADDTTLMAESKEELKSLLMRVKEESGKAGLNLNIQGTKIMASSPITSWQIDGETMETVTDLIFSCSKITSDGDCSHEIKRHMLRGRKAMTNLDSVLTKQRHHFTNRGLYS